MILQETLKHIQTVGHSSDTWPDVNFQTAEEWGWGGSEGLL